MATEDNIITSVTPVSETVTTPENIASNVTIPTQTAETTVSVDVDAKMNDLFSKFNDKIDEMSKTYTAKLDELTTTVKQKDEEINKLKNVNAQILLNSSFGNKQNDRPDFATADFDDIDWDKEAKSYMDVLDSKIFQ